MTLRELLISVVNTTGVEDIFLRKVQHGCAYNVLFVEEGEEQNTRIYVLDTSASTYEDVRQKFIKLYEEIYRDSAKLENSVKFDIVDSMRLESNFNLRVRYFDPDCVIVESDGVLCMIPMQIVRPLRSQYENYVRRFEAVRDICHDLSSGTAFRILQDLRTNYVNEKLHDICCLISDSMKEVTLIRCSVPVCASNCGIGVPGIAYGATCDTSCPIHTRCSDFGCFIWIATDGTRSAYGRTEVHAKANFVAQSLGSPLYSDNIKIVDAIMKQMHEPSVPIAPMAH